MADNFQVRDGSGTLITIGSTDTGGGTHATKHRVCDATGAFFLPPMDAAGRAGFVRLTDGVNTMPAGDAAARAVYTAPPGVLTPTASFARPADTNAYASGDLVANSTAAGSVTPLSFTATRIATGNAKIRRVRLRKSGTGVANASFRVHFYAAGPAPANGDNGAWSTDQVANYLGSFDCDMGGANGRVFTDGASVVGTPSVGAEVNFALAAGQTVYALVEARAAYAPASGETFAVTPEVEQH